MQITLTVIAAIAVYVSSVAAQDGPAPPRLTIPGALPIPIRPQFRNDKLVRIRRPIGRPPLSLNAIPAPLSPRLLEEAKPVTEEPEDDIPDNFVPQISSQPSPQAQALFQDPNAIQQEASAEDPQVAIPRFQPQERPAPRLQDIQTGGQRFSITPERPRHIPRPRPVQRESRPQYDQDSPQTFRQAPQRPSKPIPQPVHVPQLEVRERKPVAQILRKYRDEHEDGSITWGFENDDGSFKEETIGVDCVTRGRYGYVDPDGLRREYNYETGILCDPNKRGQSQEVDQSGFVDYEGNRAVLPNGVEIDLSTMGKKKSRRPGALSSQQQQQFYRN